MNIPRIFQNLHIWKTENMNVFFEFYNNIKYFWVAHEQMFMLVSTVPITSHEAYIDRQN